MTNLERPRAEDPYDKLPEVGEFVLTSEDFADGARLDQTFASAKIGGKDLSPSLSWSGAPEATKSYVVTCFDPDAPTPSGFWHWSLVDIPASTTGLPQGAGSGYVMPEGSFHVRNDNGTKQYVGCAPPEGDREHRYIFVAHAVDVDELGVDDEASPTMVAFNLAFHTLARARLTGVYST